MKKYCLLLATLFAFHVSMAQSQQKVTLFPQGAPGENTSYVETDDWNGPKVGGLPVLRKTNVGSPEITIFKAAPSNSAHTAMIVCPGGGYNILAYDMEGTEICSWLNSLGISAVLLKYRVPRRKGRAIYEAPLQDAQRAISYVRYHADELGIDSHRVGIMGFSAGAHLSTMASTSFEKRTYQPFDQADSVSCRPDFCLLVYPSRLSGANFTLADEVKINANIPPTMIVQTEDDSHFINSSLFYYYALKEAKIPAWLHLYSSGGHGYGMRNTGNQVNEWPLRAADWFKEIKMINPSKK